MNFKYIKNIVPATALLFAMGTSSCVGDLDVTPIDPSTNMTADYEAMFNKCYATMAIAGNGGANGDCDVDGLDGGTTGFVRQLFNANTLTTDEAICNWGDEGIPAFNFNRWGASHPMLKGFYYRLYFGINLCNFYLTEAAEHDATMTAEVRFLRALHYYYLMDGWGTIPFPLEVSSEPAQPKSRAEVYAFIEQELLECEQNLLEPKAKTSADANYGRADKAAAWLLLARLYLNAEVYTGTAQWAKAAEYAKKVMDSPYELFSAGNADWSAYQMLFMGDNGESGASREAILPLLQDGVTTSSWGSTLFLMASAFKEDMIGGKYTAGNNTSENWQGNRARPDLVAKFFPNGDAPEVLPTEMTQKAKDDRALFWGKGRKLSIDDTSEFTEGYSVVKFTNYYSNGGMAHHTQFPDADFFLMRTAEAYLTYAEALTRQAGSNQVTPEAKSAIDAVRSRAHADIKNTYSLNDILDEWSREFYFEGRRRIDLIRYGQFGGNSTYMWQWKGGVQAGIAFSAHLNVFALPDDDLNANPNLQPTPGY